MSGGRPTPTNQPPPPSPTTVRHVIPMPREEATAPLPPTTPHPRNPPIPVVPAKAGTSTNTPPSKPFTPLVRRPLPTQPRNQRDSAIPDSREPIPDGGVGWCPVSSPSTRPLHNCHSDAPRGIWGGALGMDDVTWPSDVFQYSELRKSLFDGRRLEPVPSPPRE